jgi:hypothetical protein
MLWVFALKLPNWNSDPHTGSQVKWAKSRYSNAKLNCKWYCLCAYKPISGTRIIVTYTIKNSDSISVSSVEEKLIESEFLMSYVKSQRTRATEPY